MDCGIMALQRHLQLLVSLRVRFLCRSLWNHAITEASSEEFKADGQILVPFALESSLSGVGKRITKKDALWYEREFTIPKKWKGRNILLHFGAVDWQAEVYVNGSLVGGHKGGFDPFSFDITPYLNISSWLSKISKRLHTL